jgi:hypothetical protein
MVDMLFENFRKASESSLEMQQELFKQWTQQWLAMPANATGTSNDWGRTVQKRWAEIALEALHRHREALDSTYKAGIQVVEETFRASDAKSPEDYKRMVEELWRKLFELFKTQSESQFRDFQSWAEKSIDIQKAGATA